MKQTEYEQKLRECWDEAVLHGALEVDKDLLFDHAFKCGYSLGKEKETITQEEIEKAAKKYAAEVDKNVRDLYGIEEQPASLTFGECAAESFREGVKFALGKQEKGAEETVIHGWVARDCDGDVFLYQNEPDRNEIAWNGYMMHSLPIDSFPVLTWESEPQEVEIIIKRKKK